MRTLLLVRSAKEGRPMGTLQAMMLAGLMLAIDTRQAVPRKHALARPETVIGWVRIRVSDIICQVLINDLLDNGLRTVQRIISIIQEKDEFWRQWAWEHEWNNNLRQILALLKVYYQYGDRYLYFWAVAEKTPDGKMRAVNLAPRECPIVHEFKFVEKREGRPVKEGRVRLIADGSTMDDYNGHAVQMYYLELQVVYDDVSDHSIQPFHVFLQPMVYAGEHATVRRGLLGWPKSRYLVPVILVKPRSADD
jgi:hypothetical protein